MSFDVTKVLKNIVPGQDGPGDVHRRKLVVASINGDNTVNLTDGAGTSIPNVPVLAGAVLAVGSNVQVMTERGAALVLGKVGAAVSPTILPATFVNFGSPTINNNAITALTPTSVGVNDGPMYPGSGTVFTVPAGQGGFYTIGIFLRYASQATANGTRQARINVNGGDYALFNVPAVAGAQYFNGSNVSVGGVVRAVLAAGATIQFEAYHFAGVSLALTGGNCVAWIERVR